MRHRKVQVVFPALIIFILAFLVRLLYNLTVARGYFPLHDSFKYHTIALNLLHRHCFCQLPDSSISTVERAPLWPAMIALIYGSFGEHSLVVRLLLCVVGACTCVLISLFAGNLFGRTTGIMAGGIAVIYPFLYIYDGWLYTESLYTLLVLALCYTLYRLQRDPRRSTVAVSGILIGLIALTRPNGLLIWCACLLWLLLASWAGLITRRIAFKSAVTMTLIALTLIAPWTLRNYVVSHAFVPVAVGDGTVFLGAYNDKTVGKWYEEGYYEGIWLAPEEAVNLPQRFTAVCDSMCEVERDAAYKTYAMRWIQGHPDAMPGLLGQHMLNLWLITTKEADLPLNRYPDRAASRLTVLLMQIITPIIFLLAASGIVLFKSRWRDFLFFYLLIALTCVESLITYGIPRFRAPLEPLLIILGAGTLCKLATFAVKFYHVRAKVSEINPD